MKKEQEDTIAYGLFLLISNSDKISKAEKEIFKGDYEKEFPDN